MYGISYLLKSFSEGAIEENCTREAIFGLVGTEHIEFYSHSAMNMFPHLNYQQTKYAFMA